MTDPVISIERLSDELMDAYLVSGMERGQTACARSQETTGRNILWLTANSLEGL